MALLLKHGTRASEEVSGLVPDEHTGAGGKVTHADCEHILFVVHVFVWCWWVSVCVCVCVCTLHMYCCTVLY